MEEISQNQNVRFFDKRTIITTILVVFGTLLYALSVSWFLNLGQFFAGGITGISQLLSFIFFGKAVPQLGLFIPLLNLPLFILGWKHISKKFAFLTMLSVIFQMIFIAIFTYLSDTWGFNPIFEALKDYEGMEKVGNDYVCNNAGVRLLLAFIGGFICGLGNALCLRVGGSTGGVDVIANALLVRKNISLTRVALIIDGSVVVLSAFICDMSTALFTFVRLISTIMTIDRFYRIYQYIRIDVITEHSEEVREYVLSKFQHGITIYDVKGGYTMKEKKVLQIFASRYEMNDYIICIKTIDPQALITVSHLTTLQGNYLKRSII